jgi:hypothetical protein
LLRRTSARRSEKSERTIDEHQARAPEAQDAQDRFKIMQSEFVMMIGVRSYPMDTVTDVFLRLLIYGRAERSPNPDSSLSLGRVPFRDLLAIRFHDSNPAEKDDPSSSVTEQETT